MHYVFCQPKTFQVGVWFLPNFWRRHFIAEFVAVVLSDDDDDLTFNSLQLRITVI